MSDPKQPSRFGGIKDKAMGALDSARNKVAEVQAGGIDGIRDKAMGALDSARNKMAEVQAGGIDGIRDKAKEAFGSAKDGVSGTAKKVFKPTEDMNFPSLESMKTVVNVVNEAAVAVKDTNRTIKTSSIPQVLSGALGAGVGGAISFAALYGLGVAGLSAAGITSGLAAAGALVGGGMVAGVFVLAAPVAALAAGGVAVAAQLKAKQLMSEKQRLYQEALRQHEAVIYALKHEVNKTKDRCDYLQSLNILLTQAIKELKEDLDSGKDWSDEQV